MTIDLVVRALYSLFNSLHSASHLPGPGLNDVRSFLLGLGMNVGIRWAEITCMSAVDQWPPQSMGLAGY